MASLTPKFPLMDGAAGVGIAPSAPGDPDVPRADSADRRPGPVQVDRPGRRLGPRLDPAAGCAPGIAWTKVLSQDDLDPARIARGAFGFPEAPCHRVK